MDRNLNDIVGVVYFPSGEAEETVQLKPKDKQNKSDTLFLYFSVITVNLLIFVKGCSIVWTSPVIPQLMSNSSDVNPLSEPITSGQISMLGGIPSIFLVLGTLLFGEVPDIIGRKNTLISISFLFLLSNLVMALIGSNFYVYIVGRSAVKLGFGFLLTVLPIYINEICEDHNRAKHGCLMMFFLPLGSLYAYLVGPVTSVRWFTLLCAAPLVPQVMILIFVIPESPIHTCARGDKAETIKTLKKLRSNKSPGDIMQDYLEIEATLKTRDKVVGGTLRKLFETRASRMGTLIGFVVCLTTHIAGVPVVMSYLAPIFNDANTNLSGNQVAIFVGVVKLIFSFITVAAVGNFGRRPLLLISCMGTVGSLVFLGVYFYLNAASATIVDGIRWLPIVAILFYISFYSLGMGSIPLSLLSELFPNDIRSTGSCFVMTVEGIFMIIIVTLFPLLSESLGVHYCMGMFGVGCLLCFVFMYFYLPETRGKSFLEIQDLLNK
ncbi:facilitated trehalose transporter Tret1 isoform X3 [Leptinotarsa decemlineata]|uniref:facilitated trehalose transporter Tret1 isoform X3 n=1 Tax=Leptinotarsa decemlineata TaxID=7539 RepID=UPI003D305BAC